MTRYLILEYNEEAGSWSGEAIVSASSPRRALVVGDVKAGTYVAVPHRSWKPLTVTVEQTTKVTIG